MESSSPTPDQGDPGARRRVKLLSGAKAALGVALLTMLLFMERIDFTALSRLIETPSTILLSLSLVLLTLPLAAQRWGILLGILGLPIPFRHLLHFIAIGLFSNLFLFGPAGGDAVRGVYAWRALGTGSGRVVVSVMLDRAIGLLGLLIIAATLAVFNWPSMWKVPALATLGISLFLVVAVSILGICVLLAAPRSAVHLEKRLERWPRFVELLVNGRGIRQMVRARPGSLLGAFALSVAIHTLGLGSLLVLADALKIGLLDWIDYVFATSLTLVANALPLTPNGIGIGEAAFDQICRWLEHVPTAAPYSSIFFAFRAVSLGISLPGLVSFVIYRQAARSEIFERGHD